jgi:hypothetical protein
VAECAGVIDVQMSLHHVANRVRPDPEPPQLGDAVLLLGHVDLELVRERAPMRVRVAGDRQRIAPVDEDVSLRVADQEERHRHLDSTEAKRAAVEHIQRRASRHGSILRSTGRSAG